MEHLTEFLSSGGVFVLLAALLSAFVAMFIYLMNRVDKVLEILLKKIEDDANNRVADQRNLNEKLNAIDKRFDAMDTRFDAMDARFDAMDTRSDAMDEKIDGVHDSLSNKIDNLQKEVNENAQRTARIEGYLEMVSRTRRESELTIQTQPLRGDQPDAAAGAAEPSSKAAGQSEATGKDGGFDYQVPPDRGNQQEAAAGVAEPPPNNATET